LEVNIHSHPSENGYGLQVAMRSFSGN
jgi:hypothetical protein